MSAPANIPQSVGTAPSQGQAPSELQDWGHKLSDQEFAEGDAPFRAAAKLETPTATLRPDLKVIHSEPLRSFIQMRARLCSLRVPRIVGCADSADLMEIADHMTEVADTVDSYFASLGRLVQRHAPTLIDRSIFEHPVMEAISGNAVFEVMRAADVLKEDRP